MAEQLQTRTLTMPDLSLLAYAQHMVATAQSLAAKRMFEAFVEQELRWLRANGGFQRPRARNTEHREPQSDC